MGPGALAATGKYVRDLASHGQKTITAFIVDDPWNSVTGFPVRSLIEWTYEGQFEPEQYESLEL